EIMDNNGARDIDERRHEWEKSGWRSGSAPAVDQSDRAIPVVEERLTVGKRETDRRGVRIFSEVHEQVVEQPVNLREEHVTVERRPVDRPATEADFAAFKEGTIELTEVREEPVVTKEARVVEEVVVKKDVKERKETVRDKVRKNDVRVE